METKHRGDEGAWRKPEAHMQNFPSFFRLTRIGRWMLQSTEASVLCNNVSAVVTCEHVNSDSSPTHLQSIGRGQKAGDPDRCSLDTHGHAVPKDPRAGAASHGVALPRTSMLVPRITKSHSKPRRHHLAGG
jgi:hypothetical protein